MSDHADRAPAPRSLTPDDLRPFYRSVYRDAGVAARELAAWRPAICPYEPIAPWVPAGARVVDFGCGAGALLALLSQTGRIASGTGYDVSEDAIRAAKAAQARLSHDVLTFHRIADFKDISSGSVDALIMIDVLHHIPPPRQREAIRAAAQRVAEGGRLIYKDMVSFPVWRRWANTMHDLVLARQLVNYVPVATVEQWARDEGLTLLHGEDYTRFVYGHELRVFAR